VRQLTIRNLKCNYFTYVLSCRKIKNLIYLKIVRNNSNLPLILLSINSQKKEVILWDTPENISSFSKKFLLSSDRKNINITTFNKSILIGVILSDGHIEREKNWNARIRFEQSIKHIEYIWYLFTQLAILRSSKPNMAKRELRGKYFYSLAFKTRRLNSLNEIYNLFYKEDKRYLNEDIFHYFNYVVLTHWIMGDGSKYGTGIVLCTDSYNIKDVVLLINILLIKFNVESYIGYVTSLSPFNKNKISRLPRIYINGENFDKIRLLIKPYILNCFLYKIE
jgi:hypothetical protein